MRALPGGSGERDDGRYEIVLASGPDHDGLTAELWLAGELVAEARLHGGVLHFHLHAPKDDDWWQNEYEEFSAQLERLGARLRGPTA